MYIGAIFIFTTDTCPITHYLSCTQMAAVVWTECCRPLVKLLYSQSDWLSAL